MTEISRLRATSIALLVVAGLFYFGVLAWFTAVFVALGIQGSPTLYLLMCVLACIYSVRLFLTWAGLAVAGFALDFRGLHVKQGRLIFVAPWVRAFRSGEITAVRRVDLRLGWPKRPFIEFEITGGGRWRLPGFILRETVDDAVKAARRSLDLA